MLNRPNIFLHLAFFRLGPALDLLPIPGEIFGEFAIDRLNIKLNQLINIFTQSIAWLITIVAKLITRQSLPAHKFFKGGFALRPVLSYIPISSPLLIRKIFSVLPRNGFVQISEEIKPIESFILTRQKTFYIRLFLGNITFSFFKVFLSFTHIADNAFTFFNGLSNSGIGPGTSLQMIL